MNILKAYTLLELHCSHTHNHWNKDKKGEMCSQLLENYIKSDIHCQELVNLSGHITKYQKRNNACCYLWLWMSDQRLGLKAIYAMQSSKGFRTAVDVYRFGLKVHLVLSKRTLWKADIGEM